MTKMKIYGGLRHLKTSFFFAVAQLPMKGQWRLIFVKLGGVKIANKSRCFIGRNVTFDAVYPNQIIIGDHVHITAGCVLLTHYLDVSKNGVKWLHDGNIVLEDGCFLGINTIITRPLTIGRNSVVGGGSVVTKNIPPNEIWAGNPAHFIKRRCEKERD